METAIIKGLNDKLYEKRKTAALELEKLVRECHNQRDSTRIIQIIDQLVDLFATPSNPLHARNGGLIGLAATAIALSVEISPYMERFIEPLLRCFSDPESRIRYFACESMYNIAKVSKGEILVYFNPIFDSLSKLAADVELSVKNGAELLDRLLKDIVAESAPIYFPQYPETEKVRRQTEDRMYGLGIMVPSSEDDDEKDGSSSSRKKAFSLAHFIPLLSERIYAISPFTRSYLVSWITVLDSVPDLELVSFLPEFLDGLLKYLSDPDGDVRVATENLLADFLREIREILIHNRRREEKARILREISLNVETQSQPTKLRSVESSENLPEITVGVPEQNGAFILGDQESISMFGDGDSHRSQSTHDDHDLGAWNRGQGVTVDHAAIMEVMIQQLDASHDEIQQSTALRWIAEFLDFAQDVMVPFTPRLIPAILPNLAHHVSAIQSAALQTNHNLFAVIDNLPAPPQQPSVNTYPPLTSSVRTIPTSSPPQEPQQEPSTPTPRSQIPLPEDRAGPSTMRTKARGNTLIPHPVDAPLSYTALDPSPTNSRPQSPTNKFTASTSAATALSPSGNVASLSSLWQQTNAQPLIAGTSHPDHHILHPFPAEEPEPDPFDYHATVSGLMVQFLSEYVETRVAALKWLLMLHQKAPGRILMMDGEDGTFPVLLKTLSDPSEDVIKYDLQLLAQISSSSEDVYFKTFMINLLQLFSTDRRLLEARGSLIIRQLCLTLNTEQIFRTFAEILEKEEDLDFASIMVQRLNVILTTSPELADFRKRLRNIESRDGQALFSVLYRSWCHNPVALFSLCLLAQVYEHASNLLPIVADLEISVQLLVQIDKLVQLIESPVFTSLRLQLLEPEKHPYLFKCLYGLLMLLPQSSAFISLRNRLNAVSSLGFLHAAPRLPSTQPTTLRSKLGRDDSIKWQDLLSHFRAVQTKHEKARRGESSAASFISGGGSGSGVPQSSTTASRPAVRRKGTENSLPQSSARTTALGANPVLSPLNPKARIASGATGNGSPVNRPMSPTGFAGKQQRKTLGANPKR